MLPLSERPTNSVVQCILRDGQVQALIVGAIVFIVSHRVLLGSRNATSDVFLYTIGVCMSQIDLRYPIANLSSVRVRRWARIEFVWTWSLVVYSAIATAWLSAVVYVKIVSKPEWKNIDTLTELGDAGLTIYAADIFNGIGQWQNNLRYARYASRPI